MTKPCICIGQYDSICPLHGIEAAEKRRKKREISQDIKVTTTSQ